VLESVRGFEGEGAGEGPSFGGEGGPKLLPDIAFGVSGAPSAPTGGREYALAVDIGIDTPRTLANGFGGRGAVGVRGDIGAGEANILGFGVVSVVGDCGRATVGQNGRLKPPGETIFELGPFSARLACFGFSDVTGICLYFLRYIIHRYLQR